MIDEQFYVIKTLALQARVYEREEPTIKGPFTYYVITFCLFLDPLLPSVIKFGIW